VHQGHQSDVIGSDKGASFTGVTATRRAAEVGRIVDADQHQTVVVLDLPHMLWRRLSRRVD